MSDVGDWVRFQTPHLPAQPLIDRYFRQSRDAGWYTNFGPCALHFEDRISQELLGGMPVTTAGNATAALMVAMRAVFRRELPGFGRVLVPSFTFVGSLSAITWAGYRPFFVDIDEADWQVRESSLAEALDDGPFAGALLTNTFGTPLSESRRGTLEAMLADRGVPVVLDSAAGLGSCPACELPGSATVYSLHATKPFAVGEGAVVASPDPAVVRFIRQLTNFGFDDDRELGGLIGINAKLPEILAATGLAVLDGYASALLRRRASALDLLRRLSALNLVGQRGNASSTFQFVPVLCPTSRDRETLLEGARSARVQLRTYFDPPMHRVPAFASEGATSLQATEDIARRIVALPMSDDLSSAAAGAIVDLCSSVLA